MSTSSKQQDDRPLGDDLLVGAIAVANYLKQTPRWVYGKQRALGLIHLDGTLVGSKTKLRKLLTT